MAIRPKKDTLESIRLTIQKIEQVADPARDAESIATLKRRVVTRIADLELLDSLKPGEIKPEDAPESLKLVSTASAETVPQVEDGSDLIQSDKLLLDEAE